MNIFVDESGSFVTAHQPESWNAIVGVVAAESARRTIHASINELRASVGAFPNEEVKLNRIHESGLIDFLRSLQHPGLLVFAVATDASINTLDRVLEHQSLHVADTRAAIPRMHFQGGRDAIELLASQVEALPPQLYVQLICQVGLFQDIISRSINYFVQRQPNTLREFRWRIDQKNSAKPTFEETFLKVAPPLLQSRSIRDPMPFIREFDYSAMSAYEFADGKAPDYLQTEYGLPEMEGFDVQKLLRRNLRFVDSRSSEGVQAADIIASTLRRLLRGNFNRTLEVANVLAPLLLENRKGQLPISLTGFTRNDSPVSEHVSEVIGVFLDNCRQLFARK